jgi:hypothetical protein
LAVGGSRSLAGLPRLAGGLLEPLGLSGTALSSRRAGAGAVCGSVADGRDSLGMGDSAGDGASGPIMIELAQCGQATCCPLVPAGTASHPAQTGQANCTRSLGIPGGGSGGAGGPWGAKNSAGGNWIVCWHSGQATCCPASA